MTGTALVIGGSRGIGAAIAKRLARDGFRLRLTYRHRQRHAEEVCAAIVAAGGVASAAQLDICDADAVERFAAGLAREPGRIDVLILSASGGMERGMPEGYADEINVIAQERLVEALAPLIPSGGAIVYLTSHEAHFSGAVAPFGPYATIAGSKHRGEQRLRARAVELEKRGIAFRIVSADLVEGTATAKLLEMAYPGLIAARRGQIGRLPFAEDVAEEVAALLAEAPAPGLATCYVWDPGAKYLAGQA